MAGIDDSAFKSYDIRGVYPSQVDERFAWLLGRALVAALGAARVVIGYDARLSSPALCAALCRGLADAGASATGLGLCATELVYHAAGLARGFDMGVMVTASHNPPEYNGFKIVRAGGGSVSAGSGLDEIRAAMRADAAGPPKTFGPPPRESDAWDGYMDLMFRLGGTPDAGTLKVVVDPANGVGGPLWDRLADRIGCEPVRLNWAPDGRFPAHHPDPTKQETLDALVRAVQDERADLGFAYDGDADRVVAVLGSGHVVDGSEMVCCLLDRLQAEGPIGFAVGQTISRKALGFFAERGWVPMLVPVGHAKIKALMRQDESMAFAGEDAGHYYYRDFFCCDSSVITTLHILHLAAAGRLNGLVQSLPGPWVRPLREPAFRFDDQGSALAVCRAAALAAIEEFGPPDEITCESEARILRRCGPSDVVGCDGVRADYDDWWFCVRPSGTEPVARLALEARTDRMLEERTEVLSDMFGQSA